MEIASCLEALIARQQADGSFIPRDGGVSRPDSTAWAALGMRAAGEATKLLVERARESLIHSQKGDGSVPISAQHPATVWPTTLALLAWSGWPAGADAAQRSLD